jgi:hypothetical protein
MLSSALIAGRIRLRKQVVKVRESLPSQLDLPAPARADVKGQPNQFMDLQFFMPSEYSSYNALVSNSTSSVAATARPCENLKPCARRISDVHEPSY